MIKEVELREVRPPYIFKNTYENISLEIIATQAQKLADKHQIPLACVPDQIKSGGLFNSEITDCMVLYHPENKNDYYKFAIRTRQIGTVSYVYINDFGESKNLNKLITRENAKTNAKVGAKFGLLKADTGSEMAGAILTIGKGAVGGILSIGGSKQKQAEENRYYELIQIILDQILLDEEYKKYLDGGN